MMEVGGVEGAWQDGIVPALGRDTGRGEEWVGFTQTVGGRTSMPMPRPVRHRPYIQWQAPTVWTTLSLTLHADGRAEPAMTGASKFPRHWLYDSGGELTHKSGLTDFTDWAAKSFGRHTPWGDQDSEALVTAVGTALEHSLSVQLMHGAAKPTIERLPAGSTLVRQGDPGTDVYLILDGVIRVERDGESLAEYGPGALLGERAHLEGGTRTSTLVAVQPSGAGRRAAARVPLFRPAGGRWQPRGGGGAAGRAPAALPDPAQRPAGEMVLRHHRAGAVQGQRLYGGGAGSPAQGRPHVRLPGQRQPLRGHLHP